MVYECIKVIINNCEDKTLDRNSVLGASIKIEFTEFIVDIFNEKEYFDPKQDVFQFNNFNDVGIYSRSSSYVGTSLYNKIVSILDIKKFAEAIKLVFNISDENIIKLILLNSNSEIDLASIDILEFPKTLHLTFKL
jgi:hypothetical protein